MDSENWVEFPFKVLSTFFTLLVTTSTLFGLNFSVKETFSSKLCSEEFVNIPSRKLTYPTWGKRKIIFKMDFSGDMLVPRRVVMWPLQVNAWRILYFPLGAFRPSPIFRTSLRGGWPPGWHESSSDGFGDTAIELLPFGGFTSQLTTSTYVYHIYNYI